MYLLALGLRLAPGYRRSLLPVVAVALAVFVSVLAVLGIDAAFSVATAQTERSIARAPVFGDGAGPTIGGGVDRYQVGVIERYVVAGGEASDLIPPGLDRLPRPGEVFLSPALIDLAREDELIGEAFPARPSGVVGPEGLRAPDELVAWFGVPSGELDGPPVVGFGDPSAAPELLAGGYRWFYILTVVPFLAIPIGILVAAGARTATRLRQIQIMALRALGLNTWQAAAVMTVGLVLPALGGGLTGALLAAPLISLVQSLGLFGVDFYTDDAAVSTWAAVVTVLVVAAMAAGVSLVTVARLFRIPIPPRPTLKVQRQSRLGMVVLPLAAVLLGLLITPIRLPQLVEALLLYAAVTLIVAGLALGVTPMMQQLASSVAPRAHSAIGLLAARRLETRPGATTRLASALAVGVFVVGLLQPAGEILGRNSSWEEAALAVQEAKGRALVLVREVPKDVSLTQLVEEPGIQALAPIADGFDPDSGERLGSSLLIAPCPLMARVALSEQFTCPPGPWLLQLPVIDPAPSTVTVRDAASQAPIKIAVTGGVQDLGLPPEENLNGLVVITPDHARELSLSGLETTTYLAVLDPGDAARDHLRARVSALAPGASLIDSLESSIGGSRRLAPLLGFLEVLIGAGLALLGLAAGVIGADSISDDQHHLAALRVAGTPLRTLRTVQGAVVAMPGVAAAAVGTLFAAGVALSLQARRELEADPGFMVFAWLAASAVWVLWAWVSSAGVARRLSDLSRQR